ncbi:MAG TPA: hypothetical protein VGU19_11315 [Microvirga sp.]|jgi:hypothetical protein|nr:hypothetical protein [Microvirga sp.]
MNWTALRLARFANPDGEGASQYQDTSLVADPRTMAIGQSRRARAAIIGSHRTCDAADPKSIFDIGGRSWRKLQHDLADARLQIGIPQ